MEAIYKNIILLLNQIEEVSFGEILETLEENSTPDFLIWKYFVRHPNGEKNEYYLVLPSEKAISLRYLNLPNNYCIIDCFGNFSSDKRSISPNLLLSNFLFDAKGYHTFLKKQPVHKDIAKLYTERTISFFNNEEKDLFHSNESLEALLDQWKFNGAKPLLILGERGIGKSWAVQNFCFINASKYNEDPWNNSLPLYINLRFLSDNNPNITDITELIFFHLRYKYDIKIFGNYFTFLALINTGRVLLVLDGLDEMSTEVSKEVTLKNLWQIFGLFSSNSKFILTSRINFFTSKEQIEEHFAYNQFFLKKIRRNFPESLYKDQERRIRQDFNIWEIEPFREKARLELLEKAHNVSDIQLENGLIKLNKLGESPKGSIEYEIFKLWDIPGYFIAILRLLTTAKDIPKFDLFEQCINNVLIEFNIETDRAIDRYKTISKDKLKINKAVINGYLFGVEEKNAILRKLAWYMIERNIFEFSMVDFPGFIKEIEGEDYDIVLNDLQTQTVITLKEDGKYGFISNSIFAFYVANHIFLSLDKNDPEEIKKGIYHIGRYDFGQNRTLIKAGIFLKGKFKDMAQTSAGQKLFKLIQETAIDVLINDPPYSIWQRYLTKNMEFFGITLNNGFAKERNFWINAPISKESNETDKSMVLIAGAFDIPPFFLGVTEVTNREYNKFLNSDEFEECLGKWWKKSENKHPDNPYKGIINYYHIIFWSTETRIPPGKSEHPLVWISWYAAANYCNWLSRKEGVLPYYNFNYDNDGKFSGLTFDEFSSGYRLPKKKNGFLLQQMGAQMLNLFLIFLKVKRKNNEQEKNSKSNFLILIQLKMRTRIS